MKRALLKRIIGVLLLVLILSSIISFKAIWDVRVDSGVETLTNSLSLLDYALDYETGDLEKQIDTIHDSLPDPKVRITIITMQGEVVGDTNIRVPESMENHLGRVEVQQALKGSMGHAIRYSETLKEELLYVAKVSMENNYVLRMALPFDGLLKEMLSVFGILFLAMVFVLILAVLAVNQYMKKITNPLSDISVRMQEIQNSDMEIDFPEYQFPEMNIISKTTQELTYEIRKYIKKLKKEKQIREEFFSNASHELKTPITSIKGYAELLDHGFVKDKEMKKDFIKRILSETENMNKLINDILMISRLESEEIKVTYSMIRLNTLVEEIFDTLKPLAKAKQVSMHKECKPIVLEANNKQMRELLMNLIENAVKYNRINGNVWVTISSDHLNVILTIKDDGIGISKKDQSRIFERFYRIDEGRQKQVGGTGLGLAIVKHVVEFNKGDLQLESEFGKGSTFTVRIPKELKK